MKPQFFATQADFERWLERHHAHATELLVGYWKVGSGRPSMTWPESVDAALCFGWIDGVRKRLDDARYTIRFTPRKARSRWSTINVARVRALALQGRMRPAGLKAFEARSASRTGTYSYEQRKAAKLTPAMAQRFARDRPAWGWFTTQAPSYQRTAVFWVMSGKQEATRERRMDQLIACSARRERVPPLRIRKGKL